MKSKQEKKQRSVKKEYVEPQLPFIERMFYWTALGAFILYILYRYRMACLRHIEELKPSLSKGNVLLSSYPSDENDYQYLQTFDSITTLMPFLLAQTVLANIVRKFMPKFLQIYYLAIALIGITKLVGIRGAVLLFGTTFLPFTLFWLTRLRIIPYAWFLFRMFEMHLPNWMNMKAVVGQADYQVYFTIFVSEAWILCRIISFCMEHYTKYPNGNGYLQDLLTLQSYSLYLPYVYTGPFVRYRDFEKSISAPYSDWTTGRFFKFSILFAYSVALIYGPDIWQHFFYSHILCYYPHIVTEFDNFELAGFFYGIFLNHFLKTLMLFSVSSILAEAEGVFAQKPSRCPVLVSRVSEAYKHLDVGLYHFLLSSVFIPAQNIMKFIGAGVLGKLAGLAAVNAVLLMWHQPTEAVKYFLGMNFIGYIIEGFADYFWPLDKSKDALQMSSFIYGMQLRVKCIFLGLALMLGQVGGLFFLTRNELIGKEALSRVQQGLFWGFPLYCAVNYCFAHVGVDWAFYQKRKEKKQKKLEEEKKRKTK